MKAFVFAVGMVVVSGVAVPAQSMEFSEIVVFGDSLSDIANTAGVTRDQYPPRVDGYYKKRRYSDNRIWIERVAKNLGMPKPKPGRGDRTSLKPKPNGTDWAWGGADAASGMSQPSGATEPVPALLTQVDDYLDANSPDARALYTIWAGADNLLHADQVNDDVALNAAKAVVRAVRKLERKGAKYFCVLNLPDLALTPYARDAGRGVQTVARLYSVAFNAYLGEYLKKLENQKSFDARIYFVDAFTQMTLISATVDAGLTYRPTFFVPGPPVSIDNVSDEGYDVYATTGSFPTDYLFWDYIHPTTQGHQLIAGKILQAIK